MLSCMHTRGGVLGARACIQRESMGAPSSKQPSLAATAHGCDLSAASGRGRRMRLLLLNP
eukprot:2662618-Prymnesium_polylepis.1